MELNITKITELMNKVAKGNYNKFARMLGVDVSQLYKALNSNGYGAGKKIIGALVNFCKAQNLDFNDYIFFG